MEKVLTTIKQFFRDWSEEGVKVREMCYTPIIDEIGALFPSNSWLVDTNVFRLFLTVSGDLQRVFPVLAAL